MTDPQPSTEIAPSFLSFIWQTAKDNILKSCFILVTLIVAVLIGISGVFPSVPWIVFELAVPATSYLLINLNTRWRGEEISQWPDWLIWIAWINLAVGVSLCFLTYESSYYDAQFPLLFTACLALTWILPLLYPAIFIGLSQLLRKLAKRHPKLSAWFELPNFYGALQILFLIAFLWLIASEANPSYWEPQEWLLVLSFLLATLLAFSYRHTLGEGVRGERVWLFLPHLAVGQLHIILFVTLLLATDVIPTDFDEEPTLLNFLGFWLGGIALGLTGALYQLAQRLRQAPVKVTDSGSLRPESVLAKADQYVDVHGLSERLARSVERADGGVFGITGVRGAGKSALTRHVLYRFNDQYFTLEVTAPVRHDQDMGFLIAVCRGVCGKVMTDLGPILNGTQTGPSARVWQGLRNLAVLVLLITTALSWLIFANPFTLNTSQSVMAWDPQDKYRFKVENFKGFSKNLASIASFNLFKLELRSTDQLLLQLNRILSEPNKGQMRRNQASRYLLIPLKNNGSYVLIKQTPSLGSSENSDSNTVPRMTAEEQLTYLLSENVIPKSNSEFFEELILKNEDFIDLLDYLRLEPNDTSNELHELSLGFSQDDSIKAPLHLVAHELRSYLVSKPPQEVERKSIPYNLDILSDIVLWAANNADPNLEFSFDQLELLHEVVKRYRRVLSEDFSHPTSNPYFHSLAANGRSWLDFSRLEIQLTASTAIMILLLFIASPTWRGLINLTRVIVNRRYLEAYAEAEAFNEALTFRSSQETSAGLAWQGISLGRKRTLAGRDLTLPGLTARYLRFIETIRPIYNGKLVIGIDEMDKVHDPEEVKRLLIEIKGALFAEGTFYLISISEDAARSFRRRLASGRDIFESTFDDVIDIQQMLVEPALEMLRQRESSLEENEQLPEDCLLVAALFGGGIPREIVRARRVLSHALDQRPHCTSGWAAWILLKEEFGQWEENLGDTNLSGETTILIREHAEQARNAFVESPEQANYGCCFEEIEKCIDLVDPKALRRSVGYISQTQEVAPDSDEAHYREISGDLQMVFRLLILIHLCELIVDSKQDTKDFAWQILQCHRALADKPALAETLLLNLRRES